MSWRSNTWDAEDIYAAQSGLASPTEFIEAGAETILIALRKEIMQAVEESEKQSSLEPLYQLVAKLSTESITNADMVWAQTKLASLGLK